MNVMLTSDDIAMPFLTHATRRYSTTGDIRVRDLLANCALLSPFSKHRGTTLCVYESYAARSLLAQNGISDLDRMTDRARVVTRKRSNRAVLRVSLPTSNEKRDTDLYIKLYWGRRRVLPRMAEVRSGQLWEPQPLREWHGLKRLADCGLNVPKRLAIFYRGLFDITGAVIMRQIPDSVSLETLIQAATWLQIDRHDREVLLQNVVKCLKTIHAHGLGWRGAAAKHFFVERGKSLSGKLWLLDLDGVYRRATTADHRRDFQRLLRSIVASGADEETISFWKTGLK